MTSRQLLEQWQKLADQISIGGPMPIRVSVKLAAPELGLPHHCGIMVVLVLTTTARDDGTPAQIVQREVLHGPPDPQQIYDVARKLYLHELAEQFLVSGVRIYDPHRERP